MPHIVVIPAAVTSKMFAALAIGESLERSGHRVTRLVPPSAVARAAGLTAMVHDLKIRPVGMRQSAESPASAPSSGGPQSRWRDPEEERARLEDARSFQDTLRSLEPDLVLIDLEEQEHVIAAAACGCRVALISVFFNLWKLDRAPPLHVDILPGRGIAGSRPGIALSWWRLRVWQATQLAVSRLFRRDHLAALSAYARALGFDLRQVDYFQSLLPFMFKSLPLLSLNLQELEFDGRGHPRTRYVGPAPTGERAQTAYSGDEDQSRRRLEEIASIRGNRKLVYFGFGAYFAGNDLSVWRSAIAAVNGRNDWIAVLGLGGRVDPAALGTLPENVHAFAWAPQTYALEIADCAVIHGGMTSVYECINQLVPMVVYPNPGIFDQYGTANRVEHAGLGVVGDYRRISAERLTHDIETVLGDERIRQRVSDMRAHVQRYVRDDRLESTVRDILDEPLPAPSSRR